MKKSFLKLETSLVILMFGFTLSSIYFVHENKSEKEKVVNEIDSLIFIQDEIQKTNILEDISKINNEMLIQEKVVKPSFFSREIVSRDNFSVENKFYRVKSNTCKNFINKLNVSLKNVEHDIFVNDTDIIKLKSMGYEICNEKRNTISVVLNNLTSLAETERREVARLEKLRLEIKKQEDLKKAEEAKKRKEEEDSLRRIELARIEQEKRELQQEKKLSQLLTPINPEKIELKYTVVTPLDKNELNNLDEDKNNENELLDAEEIFLPKDLFDVESE